jgi:hypothetical protein
VVQQKVAFEPGAWQIWPLGQHWPPTQVDPLAQLPQSTVWPQLFAAVPQVWPGGHVGGPDGVQQVPPMVQTWPPLQQTWPHAQNVVLPPAIVAPTVQALTLAQVPPQQVPPAQQSCVVLQDAPMALQAAWQVPPTHTPEQQSATAPQVFPLLLQHVLLPVQVCPLVQQ